MSQHRKRQRGSSDVESDYDDDREEPSGYIARRSDTRWHDASHGGTAKNKKTKSHSLHDRERVRRRIDSPDARPTEDEAEVRDRWSKADRAWVAPLSMQKVLKQTGHLLIATAVTGRNGCTTMYPTSASEDWVCNEAKSCWRTIRAQQSDRDCVPTEPPTGALWKLRESLRLSRGNSNASIMHSMETMDPVVRKGGKALQSWATTQLQNCSYECLDGQSNKRYLGEMIINAMQHTYFKPRQYSTFPECSDCFVTVNAFLLISVCSTIHMILSNWARGPKGERVKGGPKYSNLEASDVVRTFDGKMQEFERQIGERQAKVLCMITKRVRKHMYEDPAIGHTLQTDIGQFADGLNGLESEVEDEGDGEHQTSVDSGFASSMGDGTPRSTRCPEQKDLQLRVGPESVGMTASSQQSMKSAHQSPSIGQSARRLGKDDIALGPALTMPSSPPLHSDASSPLSTPVTQNSASSRKIYLRKSDFTGPGSEWRTVEKTVAEDIGLPRDSKLWWYTTVQRVAGKEFAVGKDSVFDDDAFTTVRKYYANAKHAKHLVMVYQHDMNDEGADG